MDRQPFRIIVEGMDGSGKSTLIASLADEYQFLKIITRPQGRSFDDWWPEELDRPKSGIVPIYDRFFYSELVYGPILRGKINANMELVNNAAWFLRSTGLLIYVRPHSDVIRSCVQNNPQMEGVVPHFEQLLEAYDSLMAAEMQWYGDRFYHYDWNSADAYSAVSSIVRRYLTSA